MLLQEPTSFGFKFIGWIW